MDESRGIFMVVDGLGGHAAGELAAEIAVRVIRARMASSDYAEEGAIREAIVQANNEIYELAQSNPEWHGMACVLTLAVARQDQITVGHVGDSRLYLAWNGNLRKLTSDHSPVGEQEDQGELTEEQAMQHPRRNEVFRDVGSQLRKPGEPDFIDVRTFPVRADAALLLSSDGLSDVLTSAQIGAIIQRYDGDASKTARELVDAANAAGGKDNVTVIFVPGPEFRASESNALHEVRERHAATRPRHPVSRKGSAISALAWLTAGIVLGSLLWAFWEREAGRAPRPNGAAAKAFPNKIQVNAANTRGILEALSTAKQGDVIEVPPGEYLGPLELKSYVTISAESGRHVILRSDPASTVDSGIAVVARGVTGAHVDGLRITGDDTHPLRTGILVVDSTVEIDDVEVSGAIDAGIRMEGHSGGRLLGNFVHANSGAGVVIGNRSTPRLAGNHVSENGGGDIVDHHGFEKVSPEGKPPEREP